MGRNDTGSFRGFIHKCMDGLRNWRLREKPPVPVPHRSTAEVSDDAPPRKAKPAARVAASLSVSGVTASFTGKKTHTTNRAAQRVARKVRRVAREIFRHGNKTRRARRERAAKQPARRTLSLA